ncbi:MAG: hypothetical protein M3X11_01215 [Acidobacteriota bacterium]|nr:hypothetical protein [Acidobacteriota bacterium]
MTNKENNLEAINSANNTPANLLEDLNLQEADATEVKGGPIYMKYDGIDGSVHATQNANAPTTQTREHILLARQ